MRKVKSERCFWGDNSGYLDACVGFGSAFNLYQTGLRRREREGQSKLCELDLKVIEKIKGERLMLIVQAVRFSSAVWLERCQTIPPLTDSVSFAESTVKKMTRITIKQSCSKAQTPVVWMIK